jgi:glycerol-3-phosphate acyltransferase PlsY
MNKRVVLVFAGVFGLVGAYVPVFFGWDDGFGVWSILGGLIGGLLGIWLAVKVAKRF